MRIAVTGITSGAGRRFAEIALERGHTVAGLVREPQRDDARALALAGAELTTGDVLDERALARLADGSDAVVHMAAHVGDWGAYQEFHRINVDGTARVLEAAARGGAKRFLQLSSTAVYGRPERGRVTEDWPTRKSGVPYDDSKTESERLAFRRGAELGLGVTALRPPIIYGPYDRNFLPRSLRMLARGATVMVDDGRAPLNVVWVDHLVDVALLALASERALGQAYNVMDTVAERPPSVREVTETIARAVDLPPPKISLPYRIARAAAHAVTLGHRLMRSSEPPPVTPFVVRLMTLDVIYDASKAVAQLGWQPRLEPLAGIARFARELHG